MLIVNADDFGLTDGINRGIIETVDAGVVNSVSLVANGEALEEAVSFLKANRHVQAGVHLTLIEEKPVCDPADVRSLLGDGLCFVSGYLALILRYMNRAIDLGEVELELEAQIKKLEFLGVRLVHCDSHQHIHLLPRIGRLAVELCKKHGITRIRIVNEAPSLSSPFRAIPLLAMGRFSARLSSLARKAGIATPDRFFGFNTSMRVTESIIKKAIAAAEHAVVELMCHPGYNPGAPRYSHWNMDWDRERRTLLRVFGKGQTLETRRQRGL